MRFQNRILGAALVLAGTLAAATANASDYVVVHGDCLWWIAIRHHVSLAALEAANPQIKNPNLIFPGEIVHIPDGKNPPAAKKTTPPRKTPAPKPKPPVLTPPVSPPPTTTPPTTTPPTTPPPAPGGGTLQPVALNAGGPEIDLATPQRGDQLPVGNCLVRGKAIDKSGIKLVTIDGVPATLAADGSFVGMVTLKEGVNVLDIRATSNSGGEDDAQVGVVAGTFGSAVKEAVAARVSNQALQVATTALTPLVVKDLQALQGKQIAAYTVSPFGGLKVTTKVDLGSLTVGTPKVNVDATAAGLAADVGVMNFDAKLPVDITAQVFGQNIHFTHTLDLHFDRFAAKGMLDLSKSTNTALVVDASPLQLDYSPTLASDILGQKTVDDLNKILAQIGSLVGVNLKFDEVAIVNEVIKLVWQSGLKNTIDNRLANMITMPGLKGVPLQVGPEQATVNYSLDNVSIDKDGFTLGTGLDLRLALPDVHASKGALFVGGGFPDLTGNSGIKLAVAQDMVNRALEEGWKKGLLDKTIDKSIAQQIGMLLNAVNLKTLAPALTSFIPANADIEVVFKPGAAPVVMLAQNGQATVEMTEAVVSVAVALGPAKTTLFTTDVHAKIPATFSYQNGDLVLKLQKTSFTFDLQKSIVPLPKLAVENVLDFIVPVVVDFAAGHFLGPIPIPQPTLTGVTPSVQNLAAAGTKYDFLEADLSVK